MDQKWLLGASVIMAGGIAAGLILLFNKLPDPSAPSNGRAQTTATAPEPPTTHEGTSQREDSAKESPRADPTSKEPPPVVVAKKPDPPPKPRVEILEGDERKLDRPDGEYTLEPIIGNMAIRLSGKVKTLKIDRVEESGQLDASRLDAKEIVFSGNVDGQGVAKLNAPNGTVRMVGQVSGSGRLNIQAPGGSVLFSEATEPKTGHKGSTVDGGAIVNITAKDVTFRGDLSGGAHIIVTLPRDGLLKFARLAGGASLRWKKADPSGPDPKIDMGAVTEGGTIQKID